MELKEIKKIKKTIDKEFALAIQQLESEGFVVDPEAVREAKATIVKQLEIDPTYFDNIDLASELMEEIRNAKIATQSQEKKLEEFKTKINSEEKHKDSDHTEIIKNIQELSLENLDIRSEISTQQKTIENILNKELEPPLSHNELLEVTPDQHHKEYHNLESHIESKLKTQLMRMVSGEYVDDLHKHFIDKTELPRIIDIAGITKNDANLLYLGITSTVPLTLPTITGQAGKTIYVNATEDGFQFQTVVTTDEKVKYDVADPTAGYVADKIIAGSGISVAEGAGGNANKLVITNSNPTSYTLPTASASVLGGVKIGSRLTMTGDTLSADVQTTDLSGQLHLDQTTPQTVINGFPIFDLGLQVSSNVNDYTGSGATDYTNYNGSWKFAGKYNGENYYTIISGGYLWWYTPINAWVVSATLGVETPNSDSYEGSGTITGTYNQQGGIGDSLSLVDAGLTSPFRITSTKLNTNLNADLLDGYHATSFLQDAPSDGSTYGRKNATWEVITSPDLTPYAKLDGTNQPFTGNLNISKTSPEVRFTATDGAGEYGRIYRSATLDELTLANRLATPLIRALATDGAAYLSTSAPVATGINTFSLEAWVYLNSASESGAFIKNGSTGGYGMGVGNTTLDNTGNHLIFISEGLQWYNSGVNIGTGWHLVVITCNVSAQLNFYVDGANVGTPNTGTGGINTPDTATYIGGYFIGGIVRRLGSGNRIEETRIYTKVLSGSEILAHYNSGSGTYGSVEGSLVAGYHFDDALTDYSGNSNTLSQNNGTLGFTTGLVVSPAGAYAEKKVLTSSSDNTTFGFTGKQTILNGDSLSLQVGGSQIGLIGTTVAWTIPNKITGSTDAVQLKVIGNATQTNDVFDLFASDGTTKINTIDVSGNMTLKGAAYLRPSADSVSALKFTRSNGTTIDGQYDSTNGRFRFGATGNPTATFEIHGAGTTTGKALLVAGSDATERFSVLDNGTVTITPTAAALGQSTITKGLIVNSGAGNAAADAFNVKGSGDNNLLISDATNNRLGIGVAAPATKLHILAATEQLRLGYDASNYLSTTVASTGSTTFALTGTTPTFTFSQGATFSGGITIADAKDIALNTTTGTKIGTATGQKLGFWNATPVVQQVFATGASHTVDELITVLQTLGLVKQS